MDEGKVEFDLDAELNALAKLAEQNTEKPDQTALTKTIGVLVDEWFTLKQEIDDIKEQASTKTKRQEEIEEKLAKIMKDNNISKVTSKLGSISRSVKCMPSIKDLTSFIKWVSEDLDNRLGFLEKKVNPAAVSEYMESIVDKDMLTDLLSDEDADYNIISNQLHNLGALPPGVDAYLKVKLGKRKSRSTN